LPEIVHSGFLSVLDKKPKLDFLLFFLFSLPFLLFCPLSLAV